MQRVTFILPILAGLLAGTAPAATVVRKTARSTPAHKRRARPLPQIDPTLGDNVDGEDLMIRRAAVAALGSVNGSVVVVDPTNGRILTIVNQKLALKSGFTPCSTIKLVTSVAALNERLIDPDTTVKITRYLRFNLTSALARSNNQYFARLGNELGFDRVTRYAQMLGLGEKAALDIPDEQPGVIPVEPPKDGGVGMMTSFGEGFLVTPLELAALVSAIANDGTLYYLQYPRSEAEIEQFTPKVKRTLDLPDSRLPDIRMGMKAAVDFGTARRIGFDPDDPILGKTGTCTDYRASSHMGWFGSFNEVNRHRLVVVVMLTGDHRVSGPVAAGVAGNIYRNLAGQSYFAANTTPAGGSDSGLVSAR
ncbi:MAG TPA: penicillin-binding transpeptidase domain-containing protein [Bryobacteraceae bacterium]|nr:penicillin-binding transpeptidase domain-containing protein [Bryobacteraceae bacterium]